MSAQDVRDLLAEADRQKRTADGADLGMTLIRLGEKPETTRHLLRFRLGEKPDRWLTFDEAATTALYLALAEVRAEAQRRVAEIEARVEVTR